MNIVFIEDLVDFHTFFHHIMNIKQILSTPFWLFLFVIVTSEYESKAVIILLREHQGSQPSYFPKLFKDYPHELIMSCRRVDPSVSEAHCGWNSFY